MVSVAVVWGREAASTAGTFLDWCGHALKGVRPKGIGRKEPNFGLGVVAAFWLDHRTYVKHAEPPGMAEAGKAGNVVVALPLAAELALERDIIGKPDCRTHAELDVVHVTRNNLGYDTRVWIRDVPSLAQTNAGVAAEGKTAIRIFPIPE